MPRLRQERTHSLYKVKNIKELPMLESGDLCAQQAECYVYSVNEMRKSQR